MDIGTYEAKTHFAELLDEVQAGKDYTITKRGKPIARLVPYKEGESKRSAIVAALSRYRHDDEPAFDIRAAIEEGRS
ncbi:MAG: type II toxin-antitoxin system prevent-host-death family antitoxin [Rectinemataceae bacterium]|jgi:prevent-host-death family protein